MMQVSIVGFAVGGAFLSLVNFDIPYYLIGTTLVVRRLTDKQLEAENEAGKTSSSEAPLVPTT